MRWLLILFVAFGLVSCKQKRPRSFVTVVNPPKEEKKCDPHYITILAPTGPAVVEDHRQCQH